MSFASDVKDEISLKMLNMKRMSYQPYLKLVEQFQLVMGKWH